MGMLDKNFNFTVDSGLLNGCQSIAGGAGVDVLSTNVYNAGAAVALFGLGENDAEFAFDVEASGGTTPDIRARLVASSAATLDANLITLADTGVIANANIAKPVRIPLAKQTAARQYYGVIFVQTGANHTADVHAHVHLKKGAQSNMLP